jgi:hypothetical protein
LLELAGAFVGLQRTTRRLRQIVMLIAARFLARPILKCAAANAADFAREGPTHFCKTEGGAKNDEFRRVCDLHLVFGCQNSSI